MSKVKYISFKDDFLKKYEENKDKVLEAIGLFVEGEAISNSPVVTGNYRDSWGHKTDENNDEVKVGNSAEYAIWVELGNSRGAPAQRVLTNAVENNVNRIKDLAIEVMKID